ncbi:hypothetical protein C8R43DRAFT_1205667 [Mycena crocata]|nr:hypothetical protein C8R43DRAFT_1205667 [Mycena crocata]
MDDVEFFFVDEPPLEPDDSENHLGNVRRVVACLLKDLREFGGLAAMAIKTGHDRRHGGKMEKWGRDREAERAQQRGAVGPYNGLKTHRAACLKKEKPVTLIMADGAVFVTSVDPDTGSHHITCDICHTVVKLGRIKLGGLLHLHRNACIKKQLPIPFTMPDGTAFCSVVHPDTGMHHVTCDYCGRDIQLSMQRNIAYFKRHRAACVKNQHPAMLDPPGGVDTGELQPRMNAAAHSLPRPVIFTLPDGATFCTAIQRATGVHYVACDKCNAYVILDGYANTLSLINHRASCIPRQEARSTGISTGPSRSILDFRKRKRSDVESDSQPAQVDLHPPPAQPPRVLLPQVVVLPDATSDALPPIPFQTLALLLMDLNRLLNTPHEMQAFHFAGACTVVDPTMDHAEKLEAVAWEVIRGTVLAFDIHTLTMRTTPRGAVASTPSAAIWMGAPPPPPNSFSTAPPPPPCRHCEHLLTIGVAKLPSKSKSKTKTKGVAMPGQRIVVELRHFPVRVSGLETEQGEEAGFY